MKKSLLFLILVFMILPFVSSAENEISISKEHLQLEDVFTINADNLKIDGVKFTGNVMINFYGAEEDYTLLTNAFDGSFSYDASFCKTGCLLPPVPANYTVSISLLDSRLAELTELLIDTPLVVDNALNIILSLGKVQINPEEELKLEGSVQRNADSRLLEEGEVTILFEGVEYKTVINSQKFIYEFITTRDIASDYHNIDVSITDEQGNYGDAVIQFFVVGVPEALSVRTNKDNYLPEDNVQIVAGLTDQADEETMQDVELRIYDSKGKRVLKELVLSNEEFDYALDGYAVPGEWKVMVKSSGLKIESYFEVDEIEKLEIILVGQNLEITNKGNIPYSDSLILIFDGSDDKAEKRTNLGPGQNLTLPLYTLFDEGEHKIYVENTDQTFSLDIVDNRGMGEKFGDYFGKITGQAVRKSGSGTSDAPFMVLVALIVGSLIFASFTFRKKGKGNVKGLKIPKKLKVNVNDVDEIKNRILDDIKHSSVGLEAKKAFAVDPILKSEEPRKTPSRVQFDEPMRKSESKPAPAEDKTRNLFKLFD
jgi:hypothetical protein